MNFSRLVFHCVTITLTAVLFAACETDDTSNTSGAVSLHPAACHSMNRLNYFSDSYKKSRRQFRKSLRWLKRSRCGQFGAIKVPSETDRNLTIDYAYLPATQETEKLFILTSGVHGIEGYVGSAAQQLFVREILPSMDRTKTSVLLIHAVNPWGFHHNRRVNEFNVDMNRTFSDTADLYQTENPEYALVADFMNREMPVDLSHPDNVNYIAGFMALVAQYGYEALRQSVAGGQYEFCDGLFYGGADFAQQQESLTDLIADIAEDHSQVFTIDVHTGYGERGDILLIHEPVEGQDTYLPVEYIFDGLEVMDLSTDPDIYTVTGSFVSYVSSLLAPEQIIVPMVFEVGTNGMSMECVLEDVQIARLENEGFHYGYVDSAEEQIVKTGYMEHFNPSDETYREGIMEQFSQVLNQVVSRFSSMCDVLPCD